MDSKTFDKFRELVYAKSGIALGPHKASLVSARVARRMRALGMTGHNDYLDAILRDETGGELVHFLDAISTNVTSFFREADHFEFLKEVLRRWQAEGQTRFRIWCAAASTGEEPYTLAMTALESLGAGVRDLRILATDISTRVLGVCMEGTYAQSKTETIPPALLSRYFTRFQEGGDSFYSANDELRKVLTFRRLNLAAPPYPMKGPMDVIFCRNVMIYFDEGLRGRLAQEAKRLLRPGGYFVVGHSESLVGSAREFRVIRPSVYQKP